MLFWKAFVAAIFLFFCVANSVLASDVQGIIDGTYKYAWGENIGWINFGCDNCSASITDSGLSGNVWSTQYGWINLSPSNSGVVNDAEGTLSGYAWGSNIGWINFTGVTINSSGEFLGYATIKSDNSRINFNCVNGNSCDGADFKVKTDWRPYSKRSHAEGSGYPAPPPSPPSPPSPPPTYPPETPPIIPPAENIAASVIENISKSASSAYDSFLNLFKPKQKPASPIAETPKIAPLSFKSQWNLLPVRAIREFVFAPLPYEIRTLASKFPALDNTLKNVGVKRFTDIDKLTNATLNIPSLAEELNRTIKNVGVNNLNDLNNLKGVSLNIPGLSDVNKIITSPGVGTGNIALIKGLPLSKFPLIAKKNLPVEFVFARASGELVDLNVVMSVSDKGKVIQKMSALPGKTLRLVVKPISKPRSVTGYFVFKSATPRISKNVISRSSLVASALFSADDLVENVQSVQGLALNIQGKTLYTDGESAGGVLPVENKLVLSSFEYTDPDNDGIYTADVATPSVPGEYEIITVIDYIDPELGVRQMRLITVVDPEGYVFEKNNGKETRIPSAIVSLYYLNTAAKKYELWKASDYQQDNPQITDVRGTYSFLVPEGSYYFQVEAPGYNTYKGKVFVVAEGNGIHQNIELKSGRGWLSALDWRTILLVVVFLLLVYNLFKDKLLNKSK